MKSFNQHLTEGRTQTLTVLFKSDEQMMERIYERDLKLKFGKLYKSTNYVKKGKFKGFEVVFKGKLQELEKVVRYIIGTLDKKNKIYHIHKIK